jgi:exonuclease VII small subunit
MSKKNKTIHEKMDELSGLIAWFDSDEFLLEEAIDRFKVAEALAADIEKELSSFKNDITILKQKFDSEA